MKSLLVIGDVDSMVLNPYLDSGQYVVTYIENDSWTDAVIKSFDAVLVGEWVTMEAMNKFYSFKSTPST